MLSKLNLADRSYIIGLFQGDGSLYQSQESQKGRLTYAISNTDSDIVYKLQDLLSPYVNVGVNIRERKTNFSESCTLITLTICSLEFRNELKVFVPIGKKANIVSPPKEISEQDYIRGLIDADGSVGITKTGKCFISLGTSSEDIKNYVVDSIHRVVGCTKKLNRNKRDDMYNIILLNEDAQKYASFIYKDSSLHIDRKYNKYLQLVLPWVRDPKSRKVTWNKTNWTSLDDKTVMLVGLSIEEKMKLLNRTRSSIVCRMVRLRQRA